MLHTKNVVAETAGKITIDLQEADVFTFAIDSAAVDLEIINFDVGTNCERFWLYVKQGTGSNLIVWPSSVKWGIGHSPILSQGVNKVDIFELMSLDGGQNWLGFYRGGGFDVG